MDARQPKLTRRVEERKNEWPLSPEGKVEIKMEVGTGRPKKRTQGDGGHRPLSEDG
jgi:hypothetical protein